MEKEHIMGVHSLWTLLEPVGRRVNIEAIQNKRLAVGKLCIQYLNTLSSAMHDCSPRRCLHLAVPVHEGHAGRERRDGKECTSQRVLQQDMQVGKKYNIPLSQCFIPCMPCDGQYKWLVCPSMEIFAPLLGFSSTRSDRSLSSMEQHQP